MTDSERFSITTDLAGQKKLIGPVFAAFQSAGFKLAHWCQDWTGEPVFYTADFARQVGQLAEHFGLNIVDVHGYGNPPEGATYTDELFAAMNINRAEFIARVGGKTVVLHLPARRADRVPEAIAQSMAQLRMIRPAFEALGVRAAIENLGKESHTNEFYDALLGEFSPDFLGFCYDSGHAILSNQADLLARYADRLLATHLHDNDGTKDQHRMPGEGKVDWPTVISTLKESGYAGPVNLEIGLPTGTDLDAFCRQGYQTLSRLWAGQAPA